MLKTHVKNDDVALDLLEYWPEQFFLIDEQRFF